MIVRMSKTIRMSKIHTAKVVSKVWSNEITSLPAQTSLKSPFMILIVSSQTSLLLLWQKKILRSKRTAITSQASNITHMRESGCAYFSIFFPFFTFTAHDTGTIDWNDFIFTCGFRKSSPCCCDFLNFRKSNVNSSKDDCKDLKFLTLIAAASARTRVGSTFGNEDTWIVNK